MGAAESDGAEEGTLQVGSILADRYELLGLLGEGGMGAVWAAQHRITKKRVALKVLKGNYAKDRGIHRRFLREARAASSVRHPNVVAIHDVIEDAHGPVMIMDLLDGEDLCDTLNREGPLSLQRTAATMVPVLSAVGMAHSLGIVHRDIKPENIFLARLGDGSVCPKVLDFGIAKLHALEGDAAQTAALTRTGSVMGTPYYMSPEQAYGETDINHQTDVWAMGVVLYECFTGDRPFHGDNFGQIFKAVTTHQPAHLASIRTDIPVEVADLVMRMLEKDRRHRSPDLRDAVAILGRFDGGTHLAVGAPANSLLPPAAATPVGTAPGPFIDSQPQTQAGPFADPTSTLDGGLAAVPEARSGSEHEMAATALATPRSKPPPDRDEAAPSSRSIGTLLSTPPPRAGVSTPALVAGGLGVLLVVLAFVFSRQSASPDEAAEAVAVPSPALATKPAQQREESRPDPVLPESQVAPSEPVKIGELPSPAKSKATTIGAPPRSKPASPPGTTTAPPAPEKPAAPAQLPGGILDQEEAPF